MRKSYKHVNGDRSREQINQTLSQLTEFQAPWLHYGSIEIKNILVESYDFTLEKSMYCKVYINKLLFKMNWLTR